MSNKHSVIIEEWSLIKGFVCFSKHKNKEKVYN